MELKTKVTAEEGTQDLIITRDFDLPAALLYLAYSQADLIEQWMGTTVLKLAHKKYGSYLFKTTDPKGNTFLFTGTIHDLVPDQKITRTLEFVDMPLGVQLEFLTFEALSADTSRLSIHTVYQSAAHRAQALRMPFAAGINAAHNRLQELIFADGNRT